VITDAHHRALDPTRPINDNCGWEHVQTDLVTLHDYSDIVELTKACSSIENIFRAHGGRNLFVRSALNAIGEEPVANHLSSPIICTEFGGLNIRPAEGASAKVGDWGYITADNPDDLLKRLEGLCMGIVASGLVSGFVYTQLYLALPKTSSLLLTH
jgi:hypothetical protein